ncbi:MAG: PD-(D/E)XK nuclease family protein, partial [Myxococcota bacterium]|nr:PD-(D/E)XK nuclease family protein [Myxococcota bacterium]
QMAGLQGNHFALTEAWKVYAQFFWRDLFPELPEDRVSDLLERAVQGRVDTVRELYPPLNSRAYRRLGPYSGLTGLGPHCGIYPGEKSNNLTSTLSHLELDQASFITGIEQFIGCPWQNFLNRMLRAEKTENAEMILPRVQANVLGNVVHNILEGIVKEQDPNPHIDTLKEKLEYDAFSLSWPQESHLYALFNQEAQKQLQMDKQIWATKSDVIIDIVLPYLQVERELEFSSPKKCLGAELEGCFFVHANAEGGRPVDSGSDRLNIWSSSQEHIRIRGLFKADRVDRSGDVLQMLDYKTGSVLSTKKKEADRAKEFRSSITKGQKLQPLAYAASLPYYQSLYPEIQAAQGILVFISPKQDYPQRIFSIDSNDEEELSLLARAVWTSGVAKIIGVHLPRLVRTKSKRDRLGPDHFQGNRWCTNCDYQSACRIGDTAFRRRLITVCEESNQEEVAEALPGNVSERLQEWTSFLIGKVWRIGRGS